MKVCPQCDEQYPEDVEFCAKDGAKLRRASDDDEDPMIGRVLDGRYRIEERFSEGGMGAIYLARQETVGREVAIKTLRTALADSQEFTDRFMREARVTSRISHPNCVTIHDFGQTDDTLLYLVMEYLEGETLADRLDREGMSIEEGVQMAIQVSKALEAAHAQDVVHRDLKPDNIFLLDAAGEQIFVKVLDFGISKVVDDSDQDLTQTGQVFGTPEYMSPEQGRSKPLDGRSDLYSLGCILYEIVSGQPPFRADTPMAVLVSHIQEDPKPLSEIADVPGPLSELIRDLLEKDADDRPESAAEVRRRLEAIQSGGDGAVATGESAEQDAGDNAVSQDEETTSDRSPESARAESASAEEGASPIDSQWGQQADDESYESSSRSVWLAGGLFAVFAIVLFGGAGAVAWYAYQELGGGSLAAADTGSAQADAGAGGDEDQKMAAASGDDDQGEAAKGPSKQKAGSWDELKEQFLGGSDDQQHQQKESSGGKQAGGDTPRDNASDAGTIGRGETDNSKTASGEKDEASAGANTGSEDGDDQGSKSGEQKEATGSGDTDETGESPPDKVGELPQLTEDEQQENEQSQETDEPSGEETSGGGSEEDGSPKTVAGASDSDSTSDGSETTETQSEQSGGTVSSGGDEESSSGGGESSEPADPEPSRPSAESYVSSIQPSASGPYCRSNAIRRTLEGAEGAFGTCSRDAGGVSARMVFQFMVTSDGSVIRVENFSSGMNQNAATCILDEVKGLPFGRQSGGNCTVRVTMQLSPP